VPPETSADVAHACPVAIGLFAKSRQPEFGLEEAAADDVPESVDEGDKVIDPAAPASVLKIPDICVTVVGAGWLDKPVAGSIADCTGLLSCPVGPLEPTIVPDVVAVAWADVVCST
jgi:hypothetical protein